MNYALVADRSGSGRKCDSSAKGSSVVPKTMEGCCKRDLRENSVLRTEEYSGLCTIRVDCIILLSLCLLAQGLTN